MSVSKWYVIAISAVVALFAVFPLTDTDIWWHLACAREWVITWTPVREPVVNVHEYFQQTIAFVYNLGGAPLLVAFKAFLWGCVFTLFLWPSVRRMPRNAPNALGCHLGLEPESPLLLAILVVLLFIFRYQFEIRPVLFSLLFLGIYWNVLPWLFIGAGQERDSQPSCRSGTERKCCDRIRKAKRIALAMLILVLQFLWCKFQGLYILGSIFALVFFAQEWWTCRCDGAVVARKTIAFQTFFAVLLFAMPFFHREGLNLFLYPFGLLDRLLGFSPSATIFASEIAENRSPITLLMAGENVLQSALMIVVCVVGIFAAVLRLRLAFSTSRPWNSHFRSEAEGIHNFPVEGSRTLWLLVTVLLAFVAERNFVLFLPVFFAVLLPWILQTNGLQNDEMHSMCASLRMTSHASLVLLAFLFGLWLRSVSNYDSMVACQRVPVAATQWMLENPHPGRLFNDDRAGGYLAFMNPSDSTYIDGRFILKTAEFFERYLSYSTDPQTFLHDADVQNIDRVVLPLRYYARWDKLLSTLDSAENWHLAYRDSLFVVMDRTGR